MNLDRYQRQMLIPAIGKAGQERLASSRVLLVGCGALGSAIADQLVRAGVGNLTIADRDIVEMTNLQRQVLFDEADVRESLPKAVAAATRLNAINSSVHVEPLVSDVDSENIESLLDVDLILDGTDNVSTRYLINDAAVKHGIAWIYGACVGAEGRVMTVRPDGACLRCVFPQPPDGHDLPTCDTAGVLGPAASVVASMQALAAIKLLSGNASAVAEELLTLDLWNNRIRSTSLKDAKNLDCQTCGRHQFEFLERAPSADGILCGRNAVQVRPTGKRTIDLVRLKGRLEPVGKVSSSRYLLECTLLEPAGVRLIVFPDARAIVNGVTELNRAKSIYAKYIGL
jgi:molybdopterin-synthase adenylyltransferase